MADTGWAFAQRSGKGRCIANRGGRVFPSVALEFSKLRPDARIGVIIGPNSFLISMLRGGKIDLMAGRMLSAKDMPGLSFEYLCNEPIELVAHAGHPAAGCNPVQALSEFPLILPNPGAIIWKPVDQYLSAMGFSNLRPVFEIVALPVGLNLLERSDMLRFISRGVVARKLDAGKLVALDMKAEYMSGAVGLTRKFAFSQNSPADHWATLLHRRTDQISHI